MPAEPRIRFGHWMPVFGGWLRNVDDEHTFTHAGKYYHTENTVLEPKPLRVPRPPLYAGGESEAAKNLIAEKCDAYVMHGDSPEHVAHKIADMRGPEAHRGVRTCRGGPTPAAVQPSGRRDGTLQR